MTSVHPGDDALTAAHEWLKSWHICPHDTGAAVVCHECRASLASVIDEVARARVDAQSVTTPLVASPPTTEVERLRAECDALIDRLHTGLDVLTDDDDDAVVIERLRAFRVALLKFAFREAGDPEAEEVLDAEGFPT